jgi:hypothetical protein
MNLDRIRIVDGAITATNDAGEAFHFQASGEFTRLRKAAQELYVFLYFATDFGTRAINLTCREIARSMHKTAGWVNKGLRQLRGVGQRLEHALDAVFSPLVDAVRAYGPRAAGLVFKLIRPNFVRARRAPSNPGPAPAARPEPRPYNRVPATPTTPEQLAAARSRLEAVAPKEAPTPTPEEAELLKRQAAAVRDWIRRGGRGDFEDFFRTWTPPLDVQPRRRE